jgi:hypothetical protein
VAEKPESHNGFDWQPFTWQLGVLRVDGTTPFLKVTAATPSYIRRINVSNVLFRVLNAGYVPVPTRLAVCGLPPPSSLTETYAVLLPFPTGLKMTVIAQLAPETRVSGHVLC